MELSDIFFEVWPIAVRVNREKDHLRHPIRYNAQPKLGNHLLQIGKRERTDIGTIGEAGDNERPMTLEGIRREGLAVVIIKGEGLHRQRAIQDDAFYACGCARSPCKGSRKCGGQQRLAAASAQWS